MDVSTPQDAYHGCHCDQRSASCGSGHLFMLMQQSEQQQKQQQMKEQYERQIEELKNDRGTKRQKRLDDCTNDTGRRHHYGG